MLIKVLTLSDILIPFIYSPQIKQRFVGVDLSIVCGDLPYYYLEYIQSALNVPVYYVNGNHSAVKETTSHIPWSDPMGAVDLHRRVINHDGMLLAGIEGCGWYKEGPYQYSQNEMWVNVFNLLPKLFYNRMAHGRYLDVFVTHAPPWGIHDQQDLPHRGIKAFRWLIKVFKPSYHLHGHIHIYRPDTITETVFKETCVINTFGYRVLSIKPGGNQLDGK